MWYTSLQKSAEVRNLELDLSIDFLDDLFERQQHRCALSNIPIKFVTGRLKNQTTASLDRIDSTKGYIKGNVQFVHKTINLMKMNLEENLFFDMCDKVSLFQREKCQI